MSRIRRAVGRARPAAAATSDSVIGRPVRAEGGDHVDAAGDRLDEVRGVRAAGHGGSLVALSALRTGADVFRRTKPREPLDGATSWTGKVTPTDVTSAMRTCVRSRRTPCRSSRPAGRWSSATGPCCPWTTAAACSTGADVLVVGERIEAVGPALPAPEGTLEIDATGGIVMPGHDRHPPAHVADRDARLRRGLDADPVLRLVLPGARQDLPPAGHPRRQPAVRDRVARRRRHHHRGLVARAADHRARRRRGGRAAGGAGPVRPRLRQHPGRAVGVVGAAGVPRLRVPADHARATTCSASRWPSTSPATRPSRSGPRSRWPASSARR